jgi:hypothetical protein
MNSSTIRIEKVAAEQIQNAAAGYTVRLFEGSPWNIGNQLQTTYRTGLAALDFRKEVLERSANPEVMGNALGEFVLGDPIGASWKREEGRTYLDVLAPDLNNVPWEFARFDEEALFLNQARPFCVRRTGTPPARNPEWGIRVLVAIAAEDADDTIQVWREIYAIRNAIREVNRIIDMKYLLYPSREKLQKEIEDYLPQVLHIIGHGDDDGLLLFDGTNLKPWTGMQVKSDVGAWKWKPELVYLNTCRSTGGALSTAGQGKQWTVVDRLLQHGVAAVIAMQADVQGDLAGACAGEFYKGIASGADIDSAIASGRHRIAQIADAQEDSLDPYLPKLTVIGAVEQILRYQAQKDLPECPEIEASLATFVDRDEQRRELVKLLETGKPVVVIQGPPDVGKTWLLQWCIDAWRRRKMDVRYVPISGCHTWLDVVRLIRDGNTLYSNNPGGVSRGLGGRQRAALNWRLNMLAQGIPDPATDLFMGNEDEDTGRTRLLVDPPLVIIDPHIRAMGALHAVLQEEARRSAELAGIPPEREAERPLVIVLDNFVAGDQGLTEMHFAVLQKHWLDAFVAPGTSNIRVVLGLKSAQIKDYNLETLPAGYSPVDLGFFRKEEFGDTILDLMPLLYKLGADKEKVLNWVRTELVNYDPEFDGNRLNGPTLRERCSQIWQFTMAKRSEWAKP